MSSEDIMWRGSSMTALVNNLFDPNLFNVDSYPTNFVKYDNTVTSQYSVTILQPVVPVQHNPHVSIFTDGPTSA